MHTLFSSHSWGLVSGRLHQVPKLPISFVKLSIFTVELSLREETGEPGENPRLSAVLTTSVVGGRRLDD